MGGAWQLAKLLLRICASVNIDLLCVSTETAGQLFD